MVEYLRNILKNILQSKTRDYLYCILMGKNYTSPYFFRPKIKAQTHIFP